MKKLITFLFISLNIFWGTFTHASEFLNALENATSVKQVKPKNQRSTNQKKTVTDPSVSCYPNKDILTVTQKYLYDLGLYKFSIDGVAGKGTRSAIMEAKNLLGARASPGNCLTDQDISEFRLLAENMWDDTGGSIKKNVFPKTDLDPNETTIRKLQQDLDKRADELTELTERYGIERRVTQGIIENLRADLSALKVQNAGLKLELAAVNKSNKTEFSTVSETMGTSKAPSLALNTQSAEGIVKIAEEPVEGEVSISNISQSITSVVVQITEPTFDVYSCAFNMEFTNSTAGKSFDVVMYAGGGDGKFTAAEKDIQNALTDSGLTAEDNDWSQLTVKAKKYDDPSVVCRPANQNSYSITEDGAEGVFNIDSNGQLTMTGLPIVTVN
ncbi:peptidoglycan-binding protein [Paracoccaceae bacterium]|nr:peptidoglycan-binding protein [Paracoccaceae bacterium]